MTDDPVAVDAGVVARADALMDAVNRAIGSAKDWRDSADDTVYTVRDLMRDALLSERQSAAADMLTARPRDEWHEDIGPVLWWKFPIEEPPYVGSPLDLGRTYAVEMNIADQSVSGTVTLGGWPGYHTHWTPLPDATALATPPAVETKP